MLSLLDLVQHDDDLCEFCGAPWRPPYGRIRIEQETAEDLYWALYNETSAKVHEKLVIKEAGGDATDVRRTLKNIARIRDELHRLYDEQGWEWPGRRKDDEGRAGGQHHSPSQGSTAGGGR